MLYGVPKTNHTFTAWICTCPAVGLRHWDAYGSQICSGLVHVEVVAENDGFKLAESGHDVKDGST
jgi:hypothetical protein